MHFDLPNFAALHDFLTFLEDSPQQNTVNEFKIYSATMFIQFIQSLSLS